MIAFWIILTGALVAMSCGLLGCFLVLRRMSMVGDAISHAVLPGIVIAFLLSGSRDTGFMLIGAAATGMLATMLITYFHRRAGLQADASIGVTFTFLFAVGIILISAFADHVDIDQDCVLYGEIAYVPVDLWITGGGTVMGPRAVYVLSTLLLLVILFVTLGYKKLMLTSFDPGFAQSIGIPTERWHYLLMAAVSLATVGSFESVGAILVVAFLIGPPATAYLLTRSLKWMLWVTVAQAFVIAGTGYLLASWLDASVAGCMAVMVGVCFVVAFVWQLAEKRKGIVLPISGKVA